MVIAPSSQSKVAGLLLDSAAGYWQSAIILEFLAGAILVLPPLLHLERPMEMGAGFTSAVLLILAKALKIIVDRKTAVGNAIRRRAELDDALGRTQMKQEEERLRREVGGKLFSRAAKIKGMERSYQTSEPSGIARLCAMKIEAAFWMSRLSRKAANLLTIVAIVVMTLAVVVAFLGTLPVWGANTAKEYFYVFYLIIPVIVSTDFFVWLFKARDLAHETGQICDLLVQLRESGSSQNGRVLEIVSDYDCIVAGAIPVPNWYFQKVRRGIQNEWIEAKLL